MGIGNWELGIGECKYLLVFLVFLVSLVSLVSLLSIPHSLLPTPRFMRVVRASCSHLLPILLAFDTNSRKLLSS
ncbi:MAG: hypothetical protein F6K47_11655 [Symploca sp. SIO2E6]|nr:hypothetical protein [Symploca sp. SIO2E6]